jgi:hypothetical protein
MGEQGRAGDAPLLGLISPGQLTHLQPETVKLFSSAVANTTRLQGLPDFKIFPFCVSTNHHNFVHPHENRHLINQGARPMANFMVITGKNGYEYINLDLVRHITDNGKGQIQLHFDHAHRLLLGSEDSKHIMNEITKPQTTVRQ